METQLMKTQWVKTLDFIFKLKNHFSECNEIEKYNQLSQALKDFAARKISSSDAVSIAKSVFEGHDHLFKEFLVFLPPNLQQIAQTCCQDKHPEEEVSVPGDGIQKIGVEEEKGSELKEGIEFLNKIQRRFGNSDIYLSFLTTMSEYGNKQIFIAKLFARSAPEKPHDKKSEWEQLAAESAKSEAKKAAAELYEKIFELFYGHPDLIVEFEGILEDNREVVTNEIQRIKNFQMEDRIHDIDTLWFNINEAIEKSEKVLKGQRTRGLSYFNLRYIGRLYGDRGPEVVELLKENEEGVLPRVLLRLKTKKDELKRAREDNLHFWTELHNLRNQMKNKKIRIN